MELLIIRHAWPPAETAPELAPGEGAIVGHQPDLSALISACLSFAP
jgi:hypothetical protein